MDPATAKLAVELQLSDINNLLDGLYDDEALSEGDARTSFRVLQRDLDHQLQILDGQILVLRILKEEYDHRTAFLMLVEQERQAMSDHKMAMCLAGMTATDPEVKRGADYEASLCDASKCNSDEQWDMAKEVYAAAEIADREPLNGLRTVEAGGNIADMKTKILGSKALTKCCACMEVVSSKDTLTLACKPEAHTYCRICLVDLFTSAIDNTTLFPPRCCRLPVPLETCRAILPKDLVKGFDLKVEELATPNPTHCSNAECAQFISPKNIKAGFAKCVFCGEKTCDLCKGRSHVGLCPSDPHVQLLMDFATRSRWQQCTKCKNMVELAQGCFHMTCRCRHEFCYLCGVQWKKCICPTWDENYLTRPIPAIPIPIPAPVPAVAQALVPVAPHEHDWQRVEGAECEGCRAGHLAFAMRCRICYISNCWRCIHNLG